MTELTIAKMLPVFIPNVGQAGRDIHYYVKGARHRINFMEDGVVFAFLEPTGTTDPLKNAKEARLSQRRYAKMNDQQKVKGYAVALRFLGAINGVKPEGRQETSGKVNYLNVSDPAKCHTNLTTYEEIVYRELWPHVDMVFRLGNGRVKYEFVVQPGARIEDIQLTYRGADSLSLDESGNLVITIPTGTLTDERPVAIQEKDGQQIEVESAFFIKQDEDGQQSFGFVLGEGYDPQVPLVIDPGLVFSTFLSGADERAFDSLFALDIAVDREGNSYVTTNTFVIGEEAFEGAFEATPELLIAVIKLDAIGSDLVYFNYLIGVDGFYFIESIAVDSEGSAYLAGFATSEGFPDASSSFFSGFIVKLDALGESVIYGASVGGTGEDVIQDIKIDSEGNAYVTGFTNSLDFPTTEGAYDHTFNPGGSGYNVFVSKLNADGTEYVYSTYLGRSRGFEEVEVIRMALDADGNVYVTGSTEAEDFPTTDGAYRRSYNGGVDGFVTKLNATGSDLVYSTFLGGSSDDFPLGITIDSEGNAYVTGTTNSTDFPTTEGAFDTTFNGVGAFVTKLNATGSDLVYSTLLGGSDGETSGLGIEVDDEGNACVTGYTASENFPITDDAFQMALQGSRDAFLTQLDAEGSVLLYSSYLGRSGVSEGKALAIDLAGDVYVVGYTTSTDFPTTGGAYDRFHSGVVDSFVTKWNLTSQAEGGADVSLAVADMPDPVFIGTPLTYTIQVRNNGPETATGVTLTDTLPLYVTFVSASSTQGECSISGYVVTCEIGTISSGETVTVSITVLPTRVVQLQSGISVTGNEEGPNGENNTVVITTTVITKPPRDKILDLIGTVNTLVITGSLTQVQASFLNNHLWAAIAQLDAGNVEEACDELRAFSQKVVSYQNDRILCRRTAKQLFHAAYVIRLQLGCE